MVSLRCSSSQKPRSSLRLPPPTLALTCCPVRRNKRTSVGKRYRGGHAGARDQETRASAEREGRHDSRHAKDLSEGRTTPQKLATESARALGKRYAVDYRTADKARLEVLSNPKAEH